MKKLPIQLRIAIKVIIVLVVCKLVMNLVNPGIELYNNTKVLSLTLDKKIQEQVTNYDGYYLAFTDKQTNADISKEVFLEVTSIIMENRKDGENVAWKWMQENQQIPYSEFTVFYKELSAFISQRYFDNMKIESEKQDIVQKHNTLLETYPNVFYNKLLGIDKLVYKFGYVSNQTKVKFNKQ